MKNLLFILLLAGSFSGLSQQAIDLKTLIGTSPQKALEQLKEWKIEMNPKTMSGYKDGIQIAVEDGKVSTIWIEFTARRTGAFPFQVDSVITPNVPIQNVFDTYGRPDQRGTGSEIGGIQLGGWIKWIREDYQLHCEIVDEKVVMVTLMQPDWEPGK